MSGMVLDLGANKALLGDRRTIPYQAGPSNRTANGSRIAGAEFQELYLWLSSFTLLAFKR